MFIFICFQIKKNYSALQKIDQTMLIPKIPMDFRRDCLGLISRMVRTKDLDDLQDASSPPGRFDSHHQTKLKVWKSFRLLLFVIRIYIQNITIVQFTFYDF